MWYSIGKMEMKNSLALSAPFIYT